MGEKKVISPVGKRETIPTTKEEIDAIISVAKTENEFMYVLYMVAKTTGRRLGEYEDVQVKDINFENNIMMTKVLKRRKKVEKEAILTEEVSRLLYQYIIKKQLKLDDYIFRAVGRRQIQALTTKFAKKAGIEHRFTFHGFRHFFVTHLIKQGWSYDKIAKLTGHSSVGTLAVYDHVVAHDIKDDALKALEGI